MWTDTGGWRRPRSVLGTVGWGDSAEYHTQNSVETATSPSYVALSNQSPVSPLHLKSDYKQIITHDSASPLEETELPMIKSYGGRYKR